VGIPRVFSLAVLFSVAWAVNLLLYSLILFVNI
jgi:hypothetical protein